MSKLPRFSVAALLAVCLSCDRGGQILAAGNGSASASRSHHALRPHSDLAGLEEELSVRPEFVEGRDSRAGLEEVVEPPSGTYSTWLFWWKPESVDWAVFPDVYSPDDTESNGGTYQMVLALKAMQREGSLSLNGIRALDMGVGSGPLSGYLLSEGARETVGIDVNPEAIPNTVHNLRRHLPDQKENFRGYVGDLWDALPDTESELFDLAIFNPPPFSGNPQGPEGAQLFGGVDFSVLKRFVRGLPQRLSPVGKALLRVHRFDDPNASMGIPRFGPGALQELISSEKIPLNVKFVEERGEFVVAVLTHQSAPLAGQEKVARLLEAAAGRSADQPFQICFLCNQNIERSPILQLLLKDFSAKQKMDWIQAESGAVLPWLTGELVEEDGNFISGELILSAQREGILHTLINELAQEGPRVASVNLLKRSDLIFVTSRFLPQVLEARLREELVAGDSEKIQARLRLLQSALKDKHLRENLPLADWGTVDGAKEAQVRKIMDRVVTFRDFLGSDHPAISSTGSLHVLSQSGGASEFIGEMKAALQPLFRDLTLIQARRSGLEEGPRHWVAVIGAGPAGIAAAERLRALGHEVALFSEAAPYGGLAVYGVYPNEEDPMKMAYRFKSLGPAVVTPGIHYYGNVRVGKGGDLTLDQLRELGFSAMVVAVGAEGSRPLEIPGERPDLPGLYQAKDLVAFYQGDPAANGLNPQLGKTTVWIGMGNVTVDTTHYAIHRRDYEAVEKFVRMLKPEEWKQMLKALKKYLPDESQLRRNLSFYRPGVGRTVDVDELREALLKAKLDKFLPPLDWAWEQTAGVESTRNAYWVARRGPEQKAFDPKELEALAPYIDLEDLREEMDRVAVVMGWSFLDEAAMEQRLYRLLFGHPKTGTLQGNPAEKLKQFGTRLDKARIRMRFLFRGHSIEGDRTGGIVFAENQMSGGRVIETDRIADPDDFFLFQGTPIDSVILSIGNEHDVDFGLETGRGLFATREKVSAGENPSVPAHFQSAAAEDVFLAGWALFPSAGKVGETMKKGTQAVDLAVGPYLAERSGLKRTPEALQAARAALDQVVEEISVQKVSGGQAAALHAWFIQNSYQPNNRAEILGIAQDLEERKITAELLTEARFPGGARIFAHKNAIPRSAQRLFKEQGIEVVDLPNDLEEARSLLGTAGDLSNAVAWLSPSVEWFERDEWNDLFTGLKLRAFQLVGVMPHSVDHWSLAHWAALFGAFPKAGLQVILSVEEEDRGLSIYV